MIVWCGSCNTEPVAPANQPMTVRPWCNTCLDALLRTTLGDPKRKIGSLAGPGDVPRYGPPHWPTWPPDCPTRSYAGRRCVYTKAHMGVHRSADGWTWTYRWDKASGPGTGPFIEYEGNQAPPPFTVAACIRGCGRPVIARGEHCGLADCTMERRTPHANTDA